MTHKHIAIITTGGTIEKTYDEFLGTLSNRVSVLDMMLASLELRGVELSRVALMNKDSVDMTEADHTLIARTAEALSASHDGVVVVHGTDTLSRTGQRLSELIEAPSVPIVLTGAMRPYELRSTDALQNLTETLMAVQLLDAGVYLAMHNEVLTFPGIRKDREKGCFVKDAGG